MSTFIELALGVAVVTRDVRAARDADDSSTPRRSARPPAGSTPPPVPLFPSSGVCAWAGGSPDADAFPLPFNRTFRCGNTRKEEASHKPKTTNTKMSSSTTTCLKCSAGRLALMAMVFVATCTCTSGALAQEEHVVDLNNGEKIDMGNGQTAEAPARCNYYVKQSNCHFMCVVAPSLSTAPRQLRQLG